MVSPTIIRQLEGIVGKERCLTAEEDRMVYSHDVYCESKPEVVILRKRQRQWEWPSVRQAVQVPPPTERRGWSLV